MIHVLLILFVLVVSAVLFCGWALAGIIRFTWRATLGGGRNRAGHSDAKQCMRENCRTINPLHAQFCRRCGCSLAGEIAAVKPAQRYDAMNGRGQFVKV